MEPHRSSHALQAEDIEPHLLHLLLAATVDSLDVLRIEVLESTLANAGVRLPLLDDLRALANGRRAWPKFRIVRRIFTTRFDSSLARSILPAARLQIVSRPSAARYLGLADQPQGSFGAELNRYYADNEIPHPDARGGIPAELVAGHDAIHVLAGYDTTNTGELLVAGFELGASREPWFDYLVGALLHTHHGIPFEPGTEPQCGAFEPEVFYAAYRRGLDAQMETSMNWDFWGLLEQPLSVVREQLRIKGRGNVQSSDDRWCGVEGPPYARVASAGAL